MSDSVSKLAMRANASHVSSSTTDVALLNLLRHTYNIAPHTDLLGRKCCLQWPVTPKKKRTRLSTPTLMVHSTLNLVRAVMLVSRDCVPRAWVPMQLHVIECIAVFFTFVEIRSKSTWHRKGR
jgi:hypothetical protein